MRAVLAIAAVIVIALVVVGVTMGRPRDDQASASPTPTASPTASPAASPSPTASASPGPTASPSVSPVGGRFVNATAGYSIEITPPWRRSDCFSAVFGEGGEAVVTDYFVTVREYDEESGHTGIPHGYVEVHAESNPEGLTPRQWYEQRGREVSGEQATDITFAGESAVRVAGGEHERMFIAHASRMFQIRSTSDSYPQRDENTAEQRAALIATFRFLSPNELAAASAAPTPTPKPARSFEQVAQVLADGFARKDVATLMSVSDRPCMSVGVAQGGGSRVSTAKFMDELRARFGRGMTVAVRPSEYQNAPGLDNPTRGVESTWKEPGLPDLEVDLFVTPSGDRWHWSGVLYYFVGR